MPRNDCCRMEGGHFIPGCMGCAAAMGCGKSLAQVRSYCTCRESTQVTREELENRIEALEEEMAELRKLLKSKGARGGD